MDARQQFLTLALAKSVLRFGQFTLKSGRISPYFFNAGEINSGSALAALGRGYAAALDASGIAYDMLFGPAYKGIVLAAATAIALGERDVPFAYNRKEVKDHGEGGQMVGAPLKGRVVIVDDVISAGTSVRESVQIIEAHGAVPAAVLIALDRQERGGGALSAAQEVTGRYRIPVIALADLTELLRFVDGTPALAQHRAALLEYRAQYGV